MKFLRIHLQNFGSYCETEIEFPSEAGSSDLFINGQTGAGKSTILEAVSMALYGRTRGKSVDSFISRMTKGEYGDHTSYIELEFEHAGVRYLVKRSKRRKDSSSKFQLLRWISDADGSNREWYDETKKGKSKKLVEDVIGLTYDQFIMTVMSPQKKSDLFLQADPRERRDLISSLRGIDNLKLIAERAKLKGKEITEEINAKTMGAVSEETITESLSIIDENLVAIDTNIQACKQKNEFFDSVEAAQLPLRENRNKKETLNEKIATIDSFKEQHPNIAKEHKEFITINTELQEKGTGYVAQRRETLSAKKREATASIESKLKNASDGKRLAEDSVEAFTNLKATDESKLSTAKRQLENLKANLDSSIKASSIKAGKQDIQQAVSQMTSMGERASSLLSRVSEYEKQAKEYENAIAEHKQHSKSDEKSCPMCGQKLSDESQKAVIRSLEQSLSTSQEGAKTSKKEAEECSKSASEARVTAISGYLYEIETIEADIKKNTEAITARSSDRDQFAKDEELLSKELSQVSAKFSGEEQEIETESNAVSQKLARNNELNAIYLQFGGIAKAFAFYESSEAERTACTQEIENIDKNTLALMEAYKAIANSGIEKGYIASTADLAPASIESIRGENRSVLEAETLDRGKNLQSKEQWLSQRKQNENINSSVANLEIERAKYMKIADVFGKDGIQKDIVAETKELIQLYANEALYDFSDGRFTLELSLTRKTKERDPLTREFKEVETLDVVIYDRDTNGLPAEIETLSGGEGFMVDLALRHGFYSLVEFVSGNDSRRGESAFIVDEGFAAIDKDGTLDRIIGTLNKIKRRYGQLIVISHVKEIGSVFSNALRMERNEENWTVPRYIPVTEIQA